jgi:sec-independent protein translocase protein TatB
MFGIGFGEFLMIGVVLLMAVGPRRMPVMIKSVGRAMREFRKATRELRAQVGLDELMNDEDLAQPLRRVPPRVRPDVAAPRVAANPVAPSTAPGASPADEYPAEGVDVAEARRAATPPAGA